MWQKLLGSRPGFFRVEVTAADLSDDGTVAEVTDDLLIAVMRNNGKGRVALTRDRAR